MALVVREAQRQALAASTRARFVSDTAEWLRAKHGPAVADLDTATLVARVDAAVRRASRYGLSRRLDVRNFVTLAFLVAPDFDQRPVIREILMDAHLENERRIDALLGRVSASEWQEARRSARPTGWAELEADV